MNKAAFAWGRRAAVEPEAVRGSRPRLLGPQAQPAPQTVDALVERRAGFLAAYQNEAYARRYSAAVAAHPRGRARGAPGRDELADAVARNLFRLMAIKDEYEVARLYTDGSFAQPARPRVRRHGSKLEFHLAPPLLAATRSGDRAPGEVDLRAVDDARLPLARGARRLRGTALDPFRHSADRQLERRLLADYEETLVADRGESRRRQSPRRGVARRVSRRRSAAMARSKAESAARPRRSPPSGAGAFSPARPRLAEAAE